jgi:hypothetical protein
MKQYLSLVLLLNISLTISLLSAAEDTGNWLAAPEYNGSVGARLGVDGDERAIRGLDAQLTLPFYSVLTVEWFKSSAQENREIDFNNYFVELSTDPVATWSVAANYEYNGDDQVIEVEDVSLSIQYYPNNWLIRVAYLNGEITSYFNPAIRDLGVFSTTSSTIDRDGYSVEFEYYFDSWRWQIEAQSVDYSIDLSKVQASRRLQRILSQQTLSQIFSLINWQVHSSLNYSWDKTSVRGGITHYQLAVESDEASNLYGSIDYQLSESVSLAFMLAESLDDSLLYTEFSARYQW